MANITPITPTLAGAAAAFAATVPGGDEVVYAGSGDLLIEFENGDDTSITIAIAPTQTTGVIQGAGKAPVPTRSLALAAGAHGAFLLKSTEIRAYLNANKRVPLTYTTGDASLLIRAFTIK